MRWFNFNFLEISTQWFAIEFIIKSTAITATRSFHGIFFVFLVVESAGKLLQVNPETKLYIYIFPYTDYILIFWIVLHKHYLH